MGEEGGEVIRGNLKVLIVYLVIFWDLVVIIGSGLGLLVFSGLVGGGSLLVIFIEGGKLIILGVLFEGIGDFFIIVIFILICGE